MFTESVLQSHESKVVRYMNVKNIAVLQMLLCAALWSIAGIFIKLIPWNPFMIAGARCLFAGLTTAVYMKADRVEFKINKNTLISGILLCLTFLAFVTANKMTTAANAIVLQFTAPVFVLIFSAILCGAKFKKNDILAVIFTLIGIALFFFDQLGPGYLAGNFVAIASGAFMGGMFVAVGSAHEPSERFSGILLGHIFTTVVGIPAAIIAPPAGIDGTAIVCIVILGVLQLGIPYILMGKAAAYCPPFACSLLSAVEPLLNPLWVFIFDGEAPGVFALVGAVIVIVTITVWQINELREESKEKI